MIEVKSIELIKNFEDLVGMRSGKLSDLRADVLRAAEAGIKAVMPRNFMKKVKLKGDQLVIGDELKLDLKDYDEIIILGSGKASITMAEYMESLLGDRISEGLIVSSINPCECKTLRKIDIVPSSHPIPSELGLEASKMLMEYGERVSERSLVIFLLSGGTSAMLPLPAPPVTLKDKIATTKLLLESGATIDEINAVRKHLSLIKGGWLGKKLSKARVVTLILSDVVGNKLECIGSGPTTPDPTTFKDAHEILKKYDLWDRVPESVRRRILDGLEGKVEETPKPGDPAFKKISNIIIADIGDACRAAAEYLESRGFKCMILTRFAEGEASEVGVFMAGILRELSRKGGRRAVICGGEYTVTVKGGGVGGRNQELVLASSIKLENLDDCAILSVGTDGIDGVSDAAGAIADPKTLEDAAALGLNPVKFLKENDSNEFFNRVGGAIYTGPTGTNVGDLTILASDSG